MDAETAKNLGDIFARMFAIDCVDEDLSTEPLDLSRFNFHAAIDTMQAEIDRLRKDAERYRWLRKNSNSVVNIDIGAGYEIEDTLDEAIDAALSEETKGR